MLTDLSLNLLLLERRLAELRRVAELHSLRQAARGTPTARSRGPWSRLRPLVGLAAVGATSPGASS